MNGKTIFFGAGLALLLASCSQNNPVSDDQKTEPGTNPSSPTETQETQNYNMWFVTNPTVIPEDCPIMSFSRGGEVLARLYSPANPDVEIMVYTDSGNNHEALLVATEENIAIMPLDEDNNKIISPVVLFKKLDNYSTFSVGYLDLKENSFISTDSGELPKTKADSYTNGLRNDMAAVFEKWKTAFDRTGNDIDHATGGVFGFCLKYIWRWAMTANQIGLYEDKESQEEYADGFYEWTFEEMGVTSTVMLSSLFIKGDNSFAEAVRALYSRYGKDIAEGLAEGIPEREAQVIAEGYSVSAFREARNVIPALSKQYQDKPKPYDITVSVSDITETSAMLKGTATLNGNASSVDMTIVDQGYQLLSRHGRDSWSVSDLGAYTVALKPATEYSAQAWVKTLTGTYFSEPLYFFSKGMEFYTVPDAFVFGANGGNAQVNVSCGDGIEWSIVDKPAWCSVVITSADAIVLQAEASDTNRNGILSVNCVNHYGDQVSYSITVSQIAVLESKFWMLDAVFKSTETDRSWSDGEITRDDKTEAPAGFMFMLERSNGKYYMTIVGNMYSSYQWELGTTPVPMSTFGTESPIWSSFESFEQNCNNSSIYIKASVYDNPDVPDEVIAQSDTYVWSRVNQSNISKGSFDLIIINLDTEKPIIKYTSHSEDESISTYIVDWHTEGYYHFYEEDDGSKTIINPIVWSGGVHSSSSDRYGIDYDGKNHQGVDETHHRHIYIEEISGESNLTVMTDPAKIETYKNLYYNIFFGSMN